MDKIQTAEEFILNEYEIKDINNIVAEPEHIKFMMIEFAKLHVQQTINAISNNSIHYMEDIYTIRKNELLNSYPIENIK